MQFTCPKQAACSAELVAAKTHAPACKCAWPSHLSRVSRFSLCAGLLLVSIVAMQSAVVSSLSEINRRCWKGQAPQQKTVKFGRSMADRAITPSDAAWGWMVAGNRPWWSSPVLGCDALLFSCFLLQPRTLIWSQCIIFKIENNVTLLIIFTSSPVLMFLVLHRARFVLAFPFAGCLWF